MKPTNKIVIAAVAVAAVFAIGRWSADAAPDGHGSPGSRDGASAAAADTAASIWTCPMHPQIKLPDPGDCPICGMDLVLLASSRDDDPRQLELSPAARELARVEVEPVGRRYVTRPVRMVGKVDYDETAVRTISAWVPGRLDRLFVDYTGVRVEQGDHLVSLYSPDVSAAEEELLSTRARLSSTRGEASEFLAESNRSAYQAAREKLLLWGLTEEQVVAIEERGTAEDHVILTSPSSGVVIEKLLDEGAYVQTGTNIYRVADLRVLWVRLDAYEQDLAWLRVGQPVEIAVEALPGERIVGRISFIDPIVHERTRTAKVHVHVDNADGRLKPGMFVRAVASARLGAKGVVVDRYLEGKWVSPMHPEVVKDGPGACDVCGMALVPAAELGLVPGHSGDSEPPLVVPKSAVLVTGRRAVAYVEVPDAERPTYEGREVVLGPRAGDEYIVISGLEEGERVVVNGAFRIDSSMQILARPSMMAMPGEPERAGDATALDAVFRGYLAAHRALADDDVDAARSSLLELRDAVRVTHSPDHAPARAPAVVHEHLARMDAALAPAGDAHDIAVLRQGFRSVSNALIAIEAALGNPLTEDLRIVHCPMALEDGGADWVQVGATVANPYLGSAMPTCGSVTRVLPGR